MGFRPTIFQLSILVIGSSFAGTQGQSDSIVTTYHSFVIEDAQSGPFGDDTVATVVKYPEITGLSDVHLQGQLNQYLKSLVRDPSRLMESEKVVSSPRVEPDYSDFVKVIHADAILLSYVKTEVDPGGAHPITQISSMTIDVKTLQPIPLDSLFTEGFLQIFQLSVKQAADSALQDLWLDAVSHQHDGRGMVVTDTAIVLGIDTEWDFGLSHGGRDFSEVPVSYRMLKDVIRTNGPLFRFTK